MKKVFNFDFFFARIKGSTLINSTSSGFTLLEVLVAMALISITLLVVLDAMSVSLSRALEAKFSTTAPLLAQKKIAEMEIAEAYDLKSGSGDFGDDFPGYSWKVSIDEPFLGGIEDGSEHLKQIDLTIIWGENDQYAYDLSVYRFAPAVHPGK